MSNLGPQSLVSHKKKNKKEKKEEEGEGENNKNNKKKKLGKEKQKQKKKFPRTCRLVLNFIGQIMKNPKCHQLRAFSVRYLLKSTIPIRVYFRIGREKINFNNISVINVCV